MTRNLNKYSFDQLTLMNLEQSNQLKYLQFEQKKISNNFEQVYFRHQMAT